MTELHGRCHCGALRTLYVIDAPIDSIQPRACGCSFCTRHGAHWHSSPDASVTLSGEAGAHGRYRFATATADFHFCTRCGVVLLASCDIDGRLFAVVNLAAIDDVQEFPPARRSDFDAESREQRIERRRWRWIPQVNIALE